MKIKDYPYGKVSKSLKKAADYLNRNYTRIIREYLDTSEEKDVDYLIFDSSDYLGMPKNICNRLNTDQVDWLQEEFDTLKCNFLDKENEKKNKESAKQISKEFNKECFVEPKSSKDIPKTNVSVWVTKSGAKIEVALMHEDHIKNTLDLLKRRIAEFNSWINVFEEELDKRSF